MYLSVNHVTCRYGARTALADFSLQVAHGEFVAVVGPNGSGKSTLVKSISGALRLAQGSIQLDGRNLNRLHPRTLARELAVVSQETAVEFDFTVEEIVRMGRLPYLTPFRGESPQDLAVVRQALDLTNTAHLADRPVTGLSGGERQRVMVARALAQEPNLLVLDEPTAHLDITHQIELLDLTRRLNRTHDLTVIAVLHDLNLAAQYADRLVMVKDGKCVAEGTPGAVITEGIVRAVYGARVKVVAHPEEGTPHVILLSADREQASDDRMGFTG